MAKKIRRLPLRKDPPRPDAFVAQLDDSLGETSLWDTSGAEPASLNNITSQEQSVFINGDGIPRSLYPNNFDLISGPVSALDPNALQFGSSQFYNPPSFYEWGTWPHHETLSYSKTAANASESFMVPVQQSQDIPLLNINSGHRGPENGNTISYWGNSGGHVYPLQDVGPEGVSRPRWINDYWIILV
jgi:hypothetical protein